MRVDSNHSSDREHRLQDVLSSYYEGIEEGDEPDPRALIEAHPDLAAELAEFFEVQDQLHELAAPMRDAVGMAVGSPRGSAAALGEPASGPAPDGSRCIGDYEIVGEIARGGVGIVYRARQRSLNRPVAVKVLRDGARATPDDARRFRNEAEMVANLDHPGIVPIYEVGEERGCSFFSMKLIEGTSLAERLEEYAADTRCAARADGGHRPRGPACARARHPPPRPQAVERADRRARPAPCRRFRTGPPPRRKQRPDPHGDGHGHAVVHGAGAGRRAAGRRHDRDGRARPGRDPVLPPDRPAALWGRRPRRSWTGSVLGLRGPRARPVEPSTATWRRSA